MEELKVILNENNIKYDENKLNKVYKYACELYKQEKNYTGIKIIDHVMQTAVLVANLKLDENSIYASILHEITRFDVDLKYIEKEFSKDVLNLINNITKLSYLNYSNTKKIDKDISKNMFMAIASDVRVIVIKLCDRLANIRNYKNLDEKLRNIKAKETLEIYSSIASRLGISSLRSELEDISFMYLYNKEYKYIKNKIDSKKTEREEYVLDKIEDIKHKLNEENIQFKIYGRPKHFYSIYKKMKEKNYDVYDIFDLIAIRIIVKSIKDCYTVLGIVHSMYKPMPGRFKDYIAVPKTNNYKSLHTTLFGKNGKAFEVQIRTEDMHVFAEYGAAAHFAYKEKSETSDDNIIWIRQALEAKFEDLDISNIKNEMFGEEIYVFTPKGDIKALVKGATAIDFAYSIHQKIAETITGVKINGIVKPIFTKLKNTDVVDIITSKSSKGPTMDWLKHVKSSSSRNKITAFLKKQGYEENVSRGKLLFEKEIKKQKVSKEDLMNNKYLDEMVESLNSKDLNHVYENIGFGNISVKKAINRVVTIYYKYNPKESKLVDNVKNVKKQVNQKDYILVEGLSGLLVKLAKCCSPIPGDEIEGYITNSNGVTVHRKGCKNIISNMKKVEVKWKKQNKSTFDTKLKIMANNREGITIDIINKAKDLNIVMTGIKVSVNAQKLLNISVTLNVESINDLNKVIREFKKIDSVFEVKRNR